MLLAIDIGNSNIVLGLFRDRELQEHRRIATLPHQTPEPYASQIQDLFRITPQHIRGIICSSVVPPLETIFTKMCQEHFQLDPLIVTHEMETGLTIGIDHPGEIGADRIVNAAAGYALYGGPLIIVDFGTATTLCVISSKGEYMGGAIAPGLLISSEALSDKAAKLPKIKLSRPGTTIGKDTISSMQSGIVNGFTSLVDGLVERIRKEMGEPARVIATGGLALLIEAQSREISEVRPHLTLEGLQILYDKNR